MDPKQLLIQGFQAAVAASRVTSPVRRRVERS